jgi:hypothetical protein
LFGIFGRFLALCCDRIVDNSLVYRELFVCCLLPLPLLTGECIRVRCAVSPEDVFLFTVLALAAAAHSGEVAGLDVAAAQPPARIEHLRVLELGIAARVSSIPGRHRGTIYLDTLVFEAFVQEVHSFVESLGLGAAALVAGCCCFAADICYQVLGIGVTFQVQCTPSIPATVQEVNGLVEPLGLGAAALVAIFCCFAAAICWRSLGSGVVFQAECKLSIATIVGLVETFLRNFGNFSDTDVVGGSGGADVHHSRNFVLS